MNLMFAVYMYMYLLDKTHYSDQEALIIMCVLTT